jgi:hypothetical protein
MVPFAALTTFADPSADFGLRFDADAANASGRSQEKSPGESPSTPEPAEAEKPVGPERSGDVIQFDPSRRR